MSAAAWPILRDELSLHDGPRLPDGAPTWTINDPVRHRFFRIGWAAFEILARWDLQDSEKIVDAVSEETTLEIGSEDVQEVVQFLVQNQLTRVTAEKDVKRFTDMKQKQKTSPFMWLLHHYLFFRIPLVRPDRFLTRTLPYVRWLGGARFRTLSALVLVVSLLLLLKQWDIFMSAVSHSMNWEGMVSFGIALTIAKIAHELSHAYVAKSHGLRVGTVGFAFMVLWPVLYTDVNESWLLPRKRDRLAVGAAGIFAELTLAAWATLAWVILPEGALRQGAMAMATTTWISSVFVNISPFMRFDGYFLLMDAVNMPNLHQRSFAMALWSLRETLFQLGDKIPENLPRGQRLALIGLAWAVWLYRLVVFLGIAALVYHFFIKLLGIMMFLTEIIFFVSLPIYRELVTWGKRGRELIRSGRGKLSVAVLVLLVLLGLAPVQTRISAPALMQAVERVRLFSPAPAILKTVLVRNGQKVHAGDLIVQLESPDLQYQRNQALRQISLASYQLGASGFHDDFRRQMQALRESLQTATAQRLAAEEEIARLNVSATIDGTITDLEPDLLPGQWQSPKMGLVSVVSDKPAQIIAYVTEDMIDRLEIGAAARFFITAPHWDPVDATVIGIERTAVLHLDSPLMATTHGGAVNVRQGDKEMTPERAVYRVRLQTNQPAPPSVLRGIVHIEASAASLFARLWRSALGVVMRESGL